MGLRQNPELSSNDVVDSDSVGGPRAVINVTSFIVSSAETALCNAGHDAGAGPDLGSSEPLSALLEQPGRALLTAQLKR
eukprot:7381024-Prymnesium_polylepis.1